MNNKPVFDYPLFAMGFRAFFALAGLSALAIIALWNSVFKGAVHLDNYFPATLWHAHEMLLGYATAVIAGFLLTAVRNWTGVQTVNTEQLAALCFLWLYGRLLPFYAGLLPGVLIAAVDFAFLPALIYYTGKPILKAGNYRNAIFLVMLALMAFANALIHAQILGAMDIDRGLGVNLLVAEVVLLIIFIAGRVFPFFTERGLSGVICIRNPLLDMAAIVSSLVAFAFLLMDISASLLAISAIAALIINAIRVAGWFDRRICYVPLLWVLYIGYAWVILGFGLLALSAWAVIPLSLALHAFTVGGIGVLTLGMMARVALGHTGRALKASNLLAMVFLLINIAAMFRVLFPAILPGWYGGFILLSTYCWLAAFALFGFYFTPILTSPRVDGQAG